MSDKDNLRLKNHIAEQDYVIMSLKKQLKEAKRVDLEAAACVVAHAAFGVDTPEETPYPDQVREDARNIVEAAYAVR